MKLLGFEFPDDRYYWLERDMWALPEGDGTVRIGITSFGVHLSGHFFMCRPKPPGTAIGQGATLAVAELNKTVVTIKTPVGGTVEAVNPALAEEPELIEKDPYGAGWLARLRPDRWEADQALLTHGDTLAPAMTARMQLENLDTSGGLE